MTIIMILCFPVYEGFQPRYRHDLRCHFHNIVGVHIVLKGRNSHWFRPSILSAIWGMDDVGRNFGILMMSPFAGTSVFSYMYAFISQSHSSGGICIGRGCWRLTFWISAITSLTSASLGVILWLRWKGRL